VTSHPKNFTPRLVDAMAETATVVPYLHLPVQSGSDAVLRRMKRQYTRAEYVDLAARLRERLPGLALSTDVIVGFPGETEADFGETLSLLREVRFALVFSFTYSPRPDTAAARWEHDVPPREASRRLAALMDLQQEIQRETHRGLEGRVMEVLVEGLDRQGKRSSGRSRCSRVVNIARADGELPIPPGSFVNVLIERGYPNSLLGTQLNPAPRS
jgi:tRNA-2-methylthio-N6-dimethylallyladenosine synthase